MDTQGAFDFTAARTERDQGMQRAAHHAVDDCLDWPDRAYAFLLAFAARHALFQSEDVSDASKRDARFPQPSTDRAWGYLYVKAQKAGVIEPCGMARSRRRHASVCILWRSKVFAGITG
jgi:hypothetical protein